jgi:hypothetical protein
VISATSLDLFRRINSVIRDLRSQAGPLRGTSGLISRDLVAVRLVDEIAEWSEKQEAQKPIESDHES